MLNAIANVHTNLSNMFDFFRQQKMGPQWSAFFSRSAIKLSALHGVPPGHCRAGHHSLYAPLSMSTGKGMPLIRVQTWQTRELAVLYGSGCARWLPWTVVQ